MISNTIEKSWTKTQKAIRSNQR